MKSPDELYRKWKIISISIFIGIVLLAILVLLFHMYWTVWRFERIRVFSGQDYVEEYKNYYHKVVFKPNTMPAPFGSSSKIVYFKRGQKGQMLEKIKEDVTNELDKLIEENGDIFYRYEINDDFRRVRIYEVSGGIGRSGFVDLKPGVISRIQSLIGLYHNIKEGHSVGIYQAVTFIESGS